MDDNIKKLGNVYNNFEELEKKTNEIIDKGGSGGGFTPTDEQLTAMNSGATVTKINQIGTNQAGITALNNNKLDKLTDVGEFVYSHEGAIQNSKGFEVLDEPSGSAAHVVSSKTVKAVKVALTTEINKKLTATGANRGLDITSNNVGHTNSITAQGTQAIYPVKLDEQGHVSAVGTGQAVSDTYNSTGNNQILSRKGAYNLYNDITQVKDKGWTNIITNVQYCCKNRVVSIKISGNVSADANGIIANIPTDYRPTQETPFCYGVDFGAIMDKGGWIATNGELRVHVYSTTLNQMRMFITYTI